MSIADVTSRISELQSQLATMVPAGSGAAAAASFSSALGQATAAAGSAGSTTSTLPSSDIGSSTTTDATSDVSTTSGALDAGDASGDAVVADARRYLGTPYVWGGTDPAKGLDCSGLVQRVYADLGYHLPRVASDQAAVGRAVSSLAQARPGDILAFGSPAHHVGIYIGGGQMIEAPRPGLKVRVGPVYETPTAIRRVVDTAPAASAAGLVASSAPVTSDVPYASLFNAASRKYGVSARLLSAVAHQESNYSPTAVSGAGARGLMQLMPATAKGLGVTNPMDPAQSIDGAARMLHGLISTFGRTDLALAAYNAGPGAVRKYDGIPPYRETQDYVRNVMTMAGAA